MNGEKDLMKKFYWGQIFNVKNNLKGMINLIPSSKKKISERFIRFEERTKHRVDTMYDDERLERYNAMIGSWKYEEGFIDKTFKFLYHLIKERIMTASISGENM
jgi:hypothetical protein